MIDFIFLWLRGLVFTILAVFFVALIYGLFGITVAVPHVMVPILILILMPIVFGIITEGK